MGNEKNEKKLVSLKNSVLNTTNEMILNRKENQLPLVSTTVSSKVAPKSALFINFKGLIKIWYGLEGFICSPWSYLVPAFEPARRPENILIKLHYSSLDNKSYE